MPKKPLELYQINLKVEFLSQEYGSYEAEIHLPLNIERESITEGMTGMIPALLESAHNKWAQARDQRLKEIEEEKPKEDAPSI